MEQNYSSDFIPTNSDIGNIEILDRCGTTSLAYKASIDGRFYFIKRLRPELCRKECYRNLFYTAVTRAQNMVILVGREDKVRTMVENNRQSMRYTGLCRILGEVEK